MRFLPVAASILPCLLTLLGCVAPEEPVSTHTLSAESVEQEYTVRVYEPRGSEGPRPLVLLFDGDDWTTRTARILDELVAEGSIPAPILVSVGYGDTPNARGRDLTPPGPGIPQGHGEISPFFRFLSEELVPWVDARFDTIATPSHRVLMGHSFGGLATVWGVFEARETFAHGVALSPSLVFGEGVMFEIEAAWAEGHETLPARLYLGAGTLEDHSLAGLTEAFGDRLDSRRYADLALRTELVAGRTHVDLFPPAAASGLQFVLEGL